MIGCEKSVELASKGCEALIESNDYIEAISLLSKAIEVKANDYRFYANRSLAFYRMGRYGLALKDSQMAVQLNAKCAANYVRKASALNALGRYTEAEVSANTALKLDSRSRLAAYELLLSRKMAFISMGFDKEDVMAMIVNCRSITHGLQKLAKLIQTKDF
jgi:tetratricopeptide (TPR) repeat protein